jgi:prevent-host-death family protein
VKPVNVHDAKTNFSKLLARVEKGETVVIARNGKPIAELRPILAAQSPREFGTLAGKIWVADDFNDPLPPELLELFEK